MSERCSEKCGIDVVGGIPAFQAGWTSSSLVCRTKKESHEKNDGDRRVRVYRV
jgi:hypothetical protein